MDLKRATAILSMALVPGLPAEQASEQAIDILLRIPSFAGSESEAARLMEQITDLIEQERVPKPVAVKAISRNHPVRVGPSVEFDPVGVAMQNDVVCVWRIFWGWAFVSEEAGQHYAGWIPLAELIATNQVRC